MFLWRNVANYPRIIPVTPSYLELCYKGRLDGNDQEPTQSLTTSYPDNLKERDRIKIKTACKRKKTSRKPRPLLATT